MYSTKEKLVHLAEECTRLSREERPELIWLKNCYERFRSQYSPMKKHETDSLLFEKMYSRMPQKPSDTLKIRYWRTGRHTPVNREQCLMFEKALDLQEAELDFLIKNYYDRNDQVFEENSKDPVYCSRKAQMDRLVQEYLEKIHPGRRIQMRISYSSLKNNVRHLYYMDAMKYISAHAQQIRLSLNSHITSINYGTELGRSLRLVGEIPRKTMLRHLLILGMPYINRDLIDKRLISFGYLPLCETHTQVSGERLDWLLIQLLELYERSCRGMEPEQCSKWFQDACRILDRYFEEHGKNNLRFMYFKALKE